MQGNCLATSPPPSPRPHNAKEPDSQLFSDGFGHKQVIQGIWLCRHTDQDFRHSLTHKERAKSVSTTFNTSLELHGAGYCSGGKKNSKMES